MRLVQAFDSFAKYGTILSVRRQAVGSPERPCG